MHPRHPCNNLFECPFLIPATDIFSLFCQEKRQDNWITTVSTISLRSEFFEKIEKNPHWIKRQFRTDNGMERSNEWWQKQQRQERDIFKKYKWPEPTRKPSCLEDYPSRFWTEDINGRERWPDIKLPSFKAKEETLAQLAGFIGVSVSEIKAALSSGYRFWLLPKRGTTEKRLIMAPHPALKKVQRAILKWLYSLPVKISENTFGCVPKRNTRQNVKFHRINYIFDQREPRKHFCETLNLDIKSAFPSVKQREVQRVLLQLGILGELNALIVHLCTEMNGLPQGAPTSGYLLNLVLQDLICEITRECQKVGCLASFYVDDITITGYNPISNNFRNRVIKLVKKYGFRVAQRKTKRYRAGEVPHITGLTIRLELCLGGEGEENGFIKKFLSGEELARIFQ